jgi:hypothetical protein
MEINQNINYQRHTTDQPQSNLEKHLTRNGATAPQGAGSEIPTDTHGASAVSLSEEGRAASFAFDFNAPENLSKLNALGKTESFANAHASISYENVKDLLS